MPQDAPLRFVDRITRNQARSAMLLAIRSLADLLEAEAAAGSAPEDIKSLRVCLNTIAETLTSAAGAISAASRVE